MKVILSYLLLATILNLQASMYTMLLMNSFFRSMVRCNI